MNPDVLIIGIIVIPAIILTLLRVNAAIIFLSLCLGSVLVRFMGADAASFVGLFSGSTNVSNYTVSVALLALPAVFTTIVMIHTVRGGARLLFNIIPAVAVGLVGLLLVESLLSPGTQGTLTDNSLWQNVQQLQPLVVGMSTLASLLFLWLQRPGHSSSEGGKHRRR